MIFSFAQPIAPNNITITSGRDPAKFAAAVQQLHDRGQKLTLSIGGASYSKDWAIVDDYGAFAMNVKLYLDTYGFDGVDIDYEVDGTREQVSITHCRFWGCEKLYLGWVVLNPNISHITPTYL